MKKEFDYPIDYELYSYEEIATIISFLDAIEECYTNGIKKETFNELYTNFKKIVKSKSEEKNLLKNFKNTTGLDGYLCTKELKKEKAIIKL